jgi:hypothetical protein
MVMRKIENPVKFGATIAIAAMLLFEIWTTFQRVNFLFDQQNYIGGQSVLMRVVFRYVGAIIGSCIVVWALHLASRAMHPTEHHESNTKSWEEGAEESSNSAPNVTRGDAKQTSKVLIAIFTGIASAFFISRSIYSGPITVGEMPLIAATQPKSADELAEATIIALENKYSAYKLLLEVDPQFRSELHAIFKSPNNFKDADDVQPLLGLLSSKVGKYLPFADDEIFAEFAIQRIEFFSKLDAVNCDSWINAKFANLTLPFDMRSDLQNAENRLLASGISGLKNGRSEKLTFTSKEFLSYLTEIEKSSGTFKKNDFLKVFDEKALPPEQCKAYSSLLDFARKEKSEKLAKLWRTLMLGTRD